MNETKMLQFSNGDQQKPRKRKYRLIDERLASLKRADFRQENRHISLCRCCFALNQIGGLNFKYNIIVTITTVVEAPDKGVILISNLKR